MEKCFKFEFIVNLQKLTLALKLPCQIEVHWKRGQKIVDTGRIPLVDGVAYISKKLTIHCSMVFNPNNKIFNQKITKFSIFLITEKGTKQAGEIQLDVSEILNEKCQNKKYQTNLTKCPDKNAKMWFALSANLIKQIQADANSEMEPISSIKQIQNPKINSSTTLLKKQLPKQTIRSVSVIQSSNENTDTKIKQLQQQNAKIKEQLKNKQYLIKQNQQLIKKLNNQDYPSVKEIKNKIQSSKKQLQTLKATIINSKSLDKEIKEIQAEIFKCKLQLMNAFNYAFEIGGSKLANQLQQICGLKEEK